MIGVINYISKIAIPAFVFFVLLYGFKSKVRLYESFISGAKEGFEISLRILPYIVAILVGVKSFYASGAFESLKFILLPLFNIFGIPIEVLGVALFKPLSHSATVGFFVEILKQVGADSLASRISAVIMGSAETTFYVLAVYLGSVGIKKTRYLIPVCLISDTLGILISATIVKILM